MFLVGPNASGKSNLLDAFRFLYDLVTVGGGFHYAVNRRGGVTMLRSLSARRYPAVTVEVTLGTDQEPEEWQFSAFLRRAFPADRRSCRARRRLW